MFYTLWQVTELIDKIAVPPVPSYKSNKNNFKKFLLCKETVTNFKKLLKSIYSLPDGLLK